MKTHILFLSISLTTLGSFAQSLKDIIVKTDGENFDAAAKDFRALLQKEPTKGENYFYFGENFFKRGDIDSAEYFYSKGIEINATNPLNYVGLGKIFLTKAKAEDAKAQFYKAITLSASKNAEVFRRLSEAWLATEIKNPDDAMTYANSAIKLDPKNPENYILLGDAQLEKNPTDGSLAIKSYKTATTLNSKSAKGILSEGKLYKRARNWQLALEKYKEAEAIDPNFAPAYREKAELYFLSGKLTNSIENWKKYLELNNSDFARYRFMSALFSNKQYIDAIAEYENLKKQNYNSIYMERLAAYSYAEMGDKTDKEAYNKGLLAINDFFANAGQNFKYIALDYKYRGILLMRNGKDSLGIIEMEKGIALDQNIAGDVYSEIANTAYKQKKYDRAILYFDKKIAIDQKSLNNNDWFSLGRAYYYLAGAKQTELNNIKDASLRAIKEPEYKQLYVKADSSFSQLAKLNPTWPTVYIWKGRTNAALDPMAEKDLAKTWYERVQSNIKPEEKSNTYKKETLESFEYLGYYFVTKKDKTNADLMFAAIKEIDPNNQKQKDYFNPPKPTAPKPAGKPPVK
ncbi:MAG: tetratricopeptide repeat protein [Bacteroidota bacterium]